MRDSPAPLSPPRWAHTSGPGARASPSDSTCPLVRAACKHAGVEGEVSPPAEAISQEQFVHAMCVGPAADVPLGLRMLYPRGPSAALSFAAGLPPPRLPASSLTRGAGRRSKEALDKQKL